MNDNDYKTIAVLGDSVSAGYYDGDGLGWISRLSQKLSDEKPGGVYFNNFAVSGDRICDVWHRLGGLVMKNDPDVIFIAVGVNDTYRFGRGDAAPSMAIELRRYYWLQTLEYAKKIAPAVYVFGILPVVEDRVPARTDDFGIPMFYRNKDIEGYNGLIKEWCSTRDVGYIDFHERLLAADLEKLMADDVHPNAEGHELLAQWAFEALRTELCG